jgi:hypothetical protein
VAGGSGSPILGAVNNRDVQGLETLTHALADAVRRLERGT